MNINDAFPSQQWLKAGDLQGRDVTVTISHVASEDVGDGSKPVVYFQDKEKGLVLNRTNGSTIADLHGIETNNWQGKQITLFPTQVDYRGQQVAAIRVRLTGAVAAAPATQPDMGSHAPDLESDIPF